MARAEQRGRTRNALLLAAAYEFHEHGFAATTLGDVAARLGLVRATVHFHFATKEQLAEAIVRQEVEAWEGLRRMALDLAVQPLARLRWIADQLASRYVNDPSMRATIRLVDEQHRPTVQAEPGSGWTVFVTDQLRAARMIGDVRESVDPEIEARLLVAMYRGILQALPRQADPLCSVETERMVSLFCRYVMAAMSPG